MLHLFQSTHSQGVRLKRGTLICLAPSFQSTHSQGVRRARVLSANVNFHYFNPRTHKECDRANVGKIRLPDDFNPRTHKECDVEVQVAEFEYR